ncbi:MAG TPA: hypothetical protein DEA55_07705 [Rhodospirillaceae bacterium]|nr:hypothetical protein [Rhodospirillaceae bacterium]
MKKFFAAAEGNKGVAVKNPSSVTIDRMWLSKLFGSTSKAELLPPINGSQLNKLGQDGLLGHVGSNLLPLTRHSRGAQGYIFRLPRGYKFYVPEEGHTDSILLSHAELEWKEFKGVAARDANRSRISLLRAMIPGGTDVAFVPKDYLDALAIRINVKEAKAESKKPGDLKLIEGGATSEHIADTPRSAI